MSCLPGLADLSSYAFRVWKLLQKHRCLILAPGVFQYMDFHAELALWAISCGVEGGVEQDEL